MIPLNRLFEFSEALERVRASVLLLYNSSDAYILQ